MMVEGNSLRSMSRMCNVSINTITKLVDDLGKAAMNYHNEAVQGVHIRRLQFDEIWAFVGSKKKNVRPEQQAGGWGNVWTWTAIDVDTKLCVGYLVGGRDAGWALNFMEGCANRIVGRVQVTTEDHRAYLSAVEGAFGMDVDYTQLQKIYGAPTDTKQRRYSPAQHSGADMKVVNGDLKHVSTSFVGRQNLTVQMSYDFPKKLVKHAYAVAIHFLYYNFGRVHKTLRVTPAMKAGISDDVWALEKIASLAA